MRKFISLFLLILIILIQSLQFIVYAEEGAGGSYYRSYLNVKDAYATWGNAEFDKYSQYGINLTVDESSVSHSQIDIEILMEDINLITERNIGKFYVLFNDRIVHEFYPERTYIEWANREDWKAHYRVKPHSIDFVGADVEIQVIAVETNYSTIDPETGLFYEYVVAWTEKSDTVRFKDFPTIDRTAISWLMNIYYKLEELLSKLKDIDNKLARISQQLATLFTPSPQAQERLEKAAEELMDKMPMKEMIEQSNQLSDKFKNTGGASAGSKLTLGSKKDYFGIGVEYELFNFTEFKKEMEMIRRLLQAVIWIEFFIFVLFYLAPKLDI